MKRLLALAACLIAGPAAAATPAATPSPVPPLAAGTWEVSVTLEGGFAAHKKVVRVDSHGNGVTEDGYDKPHVQHFTVLPDAMKGLTPVEASADGSTWRKRPFECCDRIYETVTVRTGTTHGDRVRTAGWLTDLPATAPADAHALGSLVFKLAPAK